MVGYRPTSVRVIVRQRGWAYIDIQLMLFLFWEKSLVGDALNNIAKWGEIIQSAKEIDAERNVTNALLRREQARHF